MSLAELHNNPGNLKENPAWKGCVGLDRKGHCKFKTAAHGCRAFVRTLSQKMTVGKKPTLNLLIAGRASKGFNDGWAQASDTIGSIEGNPQNDPETHARTVAQWLGVSPDEDLGIFDTKGYPVRATRLIRLMAAMSRYESGTKWLTFEAMLEGIEMYIKDFVDAKSIEV